MKKYIVWALVLVAIVGCSMPTTSRVHADTCVINSFKASAANVANGSSVTLSWDTAGCTKVEIVGGSIGTVGAAGSKTITLTESTTFIIYGTKSEGGTITARTYVGVIDPARCSVVFTLDKSTVVSGKSVATNYSITNCLKAVITATDLVTGKQLGNPYEVMVNYGGSGGGQNYTITNKTSFKLQAYVEADIVVTKEVIVDVQMITSEPCTITSFALDKNSIVKGSSTTLRWSSSSGCAEIALYENDKVVNNIELSGGKTVNPTYTSTYRLIVGKTIADMVDKTITLTVTDVSSTTSCKIVSFDITPSIVTYPYTDYPIAKWVTTDCTQVSLSGHGIMGSTQYRLSPTQTTTYTLTASDATGTAVTEKATITVKTAASGDNPSYDTGGTPSGIDFNTPGWTGGGGFENGIGLGSGNGDVLGGETSSSGTTLLDWLLGKKKKNGNNTDAPQTIVIPKADAPDAQTDTTTDINGPLIQTRVTQAPAAPTAPVAASAKNPSLLNLIRVLVDRLIFWR